MGFNSSSWGYPLRRVGLRKVRCEGDTKKDTGLFSERNLVK